MSTDLSQSTLAFVGSYADASSAGLYVCQYDAENGSLKLLQSVEGLQNPTFLDLDPDNRRLYVLSEDKSADGARLGTAVAFTIQQDSLEFLNLQRTVNAGTCHIQLDRSRRCLIVSSYHGGIIGLSPLTEEGLIGEIAEVHQHKGTSVLPVQSQARAHSAIFSPNNHYVVVCDLGLDLLKMYKLDLEAPKLIPHDEVKIAAGAGPRHFVFHPELDYAYVINELNSTVTAFTFDAAQGKLNEIQTISTLPNSFQGDNACADIHISPDGRFLYGSNRGHDSIVIYAIDQQTGKLKTVDHTPTLGGHPRNFALSPDGRFLLAANRDANNIVTFKRDQPSGMLTPTGSVCEISRPVCLRFL